MKNAIKPLALATAISAATMAGAIAPAHAALDGNIGIFSSYVLRGITNSPENDNAAIQGGLDWGFGPGFYLGYWGSNLGYGDGDAKG
ncbi:MAG: TorF family putative porin, partial [Arenicellales bacterium]